MMDQKRRDEKRIELDSEVAKIWTEPIVDRGSLGIPATPMQVRAAYFHWLCNLVGLNGWEHNMEPKWENSHMTYFLLADRLHHEPFIPLIPNDENRAAEGENLRKRFALYNSAFSNYDCIKCWLQGCQCAALNIQALDDDFTLFDKVFLTL